MSVEFVAYALDRCAARGSDLLVLLALCEHANPLGAAWPSVAKIGARTRLKRRAVQLSLRRLERAGEIVRLTPGGGIDRRSGHGRTARFVVVAGRPPAELAALVGDGRTAHDGAPFNGARIDAERRTDRQGTAHETAPNGAPPCAQTVREPAAEPQGNAGRPKERASSAAAEETQTHATEASRSSEPPPDTGPALSVPQGPLTGFEKRRAELVAEWDGYTEDHYLTQRLLKDAGCDERFVHEAAGVSPERVWKALEKARTYNGRVKNIGGFLRTELGLKRDMPK